MRTLRLLEGLNTQKRKTHAPHGLAKRCDSLASKQLFVWSEPKRGVFRFEFHGEFRPVPAKDHAFVGLAWRVLGVLVLLLGVLEGIASSSVLYLGSCKLRVHGVHVKESKFFIRSRVHETICFEYRTWPLCSGVLDIQLPSAQVYNTYVHVVHPD